MKKKFHTGEHQGYTDGILLTSVIFFFMDPATMILQVSDPGSGTLGEMGRKLRDFFYTILEIMKAHYQLGTV